VREDIAEGDTVWIKMPESIQSVPLEAIVSWVRQWGTSHLIPGIGVKFHKNLT
jgi:Tfp pilus assembly protein PilZ